MTYINKCLICDKQFVDGDFLISHIYTKHIEIVNNSFSQRMNTKKGDRYRKLVYTGIRYKKNKRHYLLCKCDCGNSTWIYSFRSQSCGCLRTSNIKNKRFGRLVVLYEYGKEDGNITWFCKCDCGQHVIKSGQNLRLGRTKSCGCLRYNRSK